MTAGISDTQPRAEAELVRLMRAATIQQRFALLSSLCQTAMQLSWRAIRRANPGLSDKEIDMLFIEYRHGKELADKVRAYIGLKPR